ncbi:aminotransferase class I/II-fold pyridoxal phosphate-dependent enzyme [Sphingomonas sp. LM7]|uniref:aminotransferase class I/II-fold pyridoxal phosphate-dependent enzyme n=1 Tax=Sphingomonas sp. LM7 TaxID=1938607 RepID=UPI000983F824|nr:aminotransferase class I/II-fold pyridoxal phosphate-dependent enzyme [Sphingomonas sp. LM7]AQR73527.1 hypothetical protein BXU08_07635 [Sphingomonas sp. LM7]
MRHRYLCGASAVKIAEAVEGAIREGKLAEGERIESVRAAAELLGVNRNTVARAYQSLRDRGLLVASGGRGGMHVARTGTLEARATRFPAGICDLASGNVDPGFLPDITPALQSIGRPPSGYDDAGDDPAFLAFARARLAEEGLDVRHPCLVSGALDAVERAMRAQVRPGATVLVEDPGYPPLFDLLRSLGLRLRPLALDDGGPSADALEQGLAAGAQAVVLTPRAQNPFGCDIGRRRARELGDVLERYPDAFLVLDDHWGPLAQGPLEMKPGGRRRWLFVRSVSKFLGPDLRLAVALGDDVTIGRMKRQLGLGPRWVSGILQRLAHALWESGGTDRLLDAARRRYSERRNALVEALVRRNIVVHGRSGIHLWLPVRSEADVAQALLARGWAVQPGEPFRLAAGPGIRLSIGMLDEDRAEALAQDIAECVRHTRARIA